MKSNSYLKRNSLVVIFTILVLGEIYAEDKVVSDSATLYPEYMSHNRAVPQCYGRTGDRKHQRTGGTFLLRRLRQ